MKTRKSLYLSVILALLVMSSAVSAVAQEVIYISEPSVCDAPKILPRFEAPVERDFVRNPALLSLRCPYEFFSDLNYHGGTYKVSTGGFWGPDAAGDTASRASDSGYYLHGLGGDAGFAVSLTDATNLAALVSYRWGFLYGDTDFEDYISTFASTFWGSWDERLNANTFGISLLVNHAFSDSFTLGTGLTYSYNTERLIREGAGNGTNGAPPFPITEVALIDREYKLYYHRLAPVVGILLKPSDRFTLDASLEAGFSFGNAGVESNLYDSGGGATRWYSDDADSRDLFGWDIAAKVRPVITLSDRLSIPLVLDFTYRSFDWEADGAAYGRFEPNLYGGIFQGGGTIDYENDARSWDITAGAGVTYDAGWATLAAMLSYTHWDFANEYSQENWVAGFGILQDGLTYFYQDDNEVRDTVSLGVMVNKEFSPMVSAALGLRYDIGWGRRDYGTEYSSPRESVVAGNATTYVTNADSHDMYQDLTLTVGLTLTPIERLTVALGGMVKFPLDPLDYEMEGTVVRTGSAPLRLPDSGPFVFDYDSSGWEYGGLLTVTYEFGCPKPVPPVREEPKIEPKLEPMSMR
jgi:hypothetical protein